MNRKSRNAGYLMINVIPGGFVRGIGEFLLKISRIKIISTPLTQFKIFYKVILKATIGNK
jgi:hypothetical protein